MVETFGGLDLKGLLTRTIDDKIGTDTPTFPTLAGIFPNNLNLFEGDKPTLTASTDDIMETWRSYLGRVYDQWPDVVYGVGADLVYAQGRPRDGGFP